MATDWNALRDAALWCVHLHFAAKVNLVTYWQAIKHGDNAFEIRTTVANQFEKIEKHCLKTNELLTSEAKDAILVARVKNGKPVPVAFCGRDFSVAHDAAIDQLYRLSILPCRVLLNDGQNWADIETPVSEMISRVAQDDVETLLDGIRDKMRADSPMNYEGLRAEIEMEAALVKAALPAVSDAEAVASKGRKPYKPRSEDAKAAVEELERGKLTDQQIQRRYRICQSAPKTSQ